MNCPSCSATGTAVLETRRSEGGAAVRRRRRCESCGHRFTTFERAEAEGLFVRKRDGGRQPFDRAKLRGSLRRAAHKRPIDPARIDSLVDRVASRLRAAGGELEATEIGRLCLDGLAELDTGAFLQFAGVDLADPEAIRERLERVRGGSGEAIAENPANRETGGREFRPSRVGSSVVTPRNQREENN